MRVVGRNLTVAAVRNAFLAMREVELFSGMLFLLLGILNFESDRYCDGTIATHFACTHPSTYYYFDFLDITLIIAGAFFIAFWILKRK